MTTTPPEPPRTPPGQPWDGPQHTYPTYLPARGGSGQKAVGLVALLFLAPCLIGLVGAAIFGLIGADESQQDEADQAWVLEGEEGSMRTDKDLLDRGDCIRDPEVSGGEREALVDARYSVDLVDCTRRHDFEVVAAFDLDPAQSTTQQQIDARAARRCTKAVGQEFAGREDRLARLALSYYVPTPETVADDRVVCVLGNRDGKPLRKPLL